MPIKKYSSFEEASKDMWIMNPNNDYYKKLKEYFAFWGKLSDKRIKKGIKKFRSYEGFIKNKN